MVLPLERHDAQPFMCEDSGAVVYFVPDNLNLRSTSPYDSDSDTTSTYSQHSASTLSSQDARGYFHDIDGRMYPLDPEIPIFLPQDEIEVVRLDHEHLAIGHCIGSNYVGPVASHLRHNPGAPPKRVLDIGTQQGSWVQQMATEFPHVEFVSLDISPMIAHTPRKNITFEVYDLYAGLAEPDASFDLVHVRHMSNRVTVYPALLREMHRVLRPGGMFISGEFENETFGAADPEVPLGDTLPRLSRGLELVRAALAAQGVMVDACLRIPGMLADSELFAPRRRRSGTSTESDTESSSGSSFSSVGSASSYASGSGSQHLSESQRSDTPQPNAPLPGFTNITPNTHHIPVTPWADPHTSPNLYHAGHQMIQAVRRGWPSLVPVLTKHAGLSQEEAQVVVNGALADHFVDPFELRVIMHYHTVWAIRI